MHTNSPWKNKNYAGFWHTSKTNILDQIWKTKSHITAKQSQTEGRKKMCFLHYNNRDAVSMLLFNCCLFLASSVPKTHKAAGSKEVSVCVDHQLSSWLSSHISPSLSSFLSPRSDLLVYQHFLSVVRLRASLGRPMLHLPRGVSIWKALVVMTRRKQSTGTVTFRPLSAVVSCYYLSDQDTPFLFCTYVQFEGITCTCRCLFHFQHSLHTVKHLKHCLWIFYTGFSGLSLQIFYLILEKIIHALNEESKLSERKDRIWYAVDIDLVGRIAWICRYT